MTLQRTPGSSWILGILVASICGAQTPAVASGHFLNVDSSRVYYEECGQGQAMVLLHDGLLHSATWDQLWPRLCARYHVLRYDRRGMGRSDAPRRPFIPTEDVTALLADRGISSATLIGSSSGAGLAIDYAFRHPDKVDRLILIDPVVHGMASSDHFLARGSKNNEPLARGDTAGAAKNWANDRYQIANGHDGARRILYDALVSSSRNLRYQGNLEIHFASPAAARMGEIRAPTLILVGEFDIADVHAYSGAVELGIWGSKREVVSDAGHLVQLEQPAFLTQRIGDFVTQTPIVAVAADRLQQYAGSYDNLMYGRPGQFLVNDARLVVRVPTERDLPLFPDSDSTFYALSWGGIRFAFHHDDSGRVTGVNVIDATASRYAPRSRS